MHKLRINPLAKQDLLDIKEYITRELDDPVAGVNVISKIIESYEELKDLPMLGKDAPKTIDQISSFLKCDGADILEKISILELNGDIRSLPGGRFTSLYL